MWGYSLKCIYCRGSTQPFIYGWGGYLFFLCQVIVQRVHIDGLCRTKDDLLTHEISGIFGAKNLIDVCSRCWHSCRQTVAVVKAVFYCTGDAEVPWSSTATLASGNLQESGSGHRHLTRYRQVMDVQPHLRPRLFSSNNTYLLPEEARMRFPTAWMWRLRWLSSEGWRAATTPWWATMKAAWSVAHCSSHIPWWFTGPEIHDIHFLTSGARCEVTECVWSGWESKFRVLLWHQRDILRFVTLQTSARKFWTQVRDSHILMTWGRSSLSEGLMLDVSLTFVSFFQRQNQHVQSDGSVSMEFAQRDGQRCLSPTHCKSLLVAIKVYRFVWIILGTFR